MENNERIIKSIEGTSNVLMDKAATAESAEEAVRYMTAASKGFDVIEKLERVDLDEYKADEEAQLKRDRLEADIRKEAEEVKLAKEEQGFKMSTWTDPGHITPKAVIENVCQALGPIASIAGVIFGGYMTYKGAQLRAETTREGLKAAMRYQEDEPLEKSALDVISKANKLD
jgi:hypothetical protein